MMSTKLALFLLIVAPQVAMGFLVSSKMPASTRCKLTRTPMQLKMTSLASGQFMPFEASQLYQEASMQVSSFFTAEETGYSSLSLYFTLALYAISLPGLYSLVKRSVETKPVQRIYDLPGPANPTAKPLRQTAAEIMAYFKALNYEVTTAEEVITFKGVMGRSNSQAAFLTFCTFMGLGSLGLVLSILLPDVGAKAYLLTLLSPYAGLYYWKNAQREDFVKVKLETADDEQTTSIIAEGGKEDLERFSRTLLLAERGKVYVKGIFDQGAAGAGAGGEELEQVTNSVSVGASAQDGSPSSP